MRARCRRLSKTEMRSEYRFDYEKSRPNRFDPLRRALEAAPVDDEPLTDDDVKAIREGREERVKTEMVSHDEIKR